MESNQNNWEQILRAKAQAEADDTVEQERLSSALSELPASERELIEKLEQDGLLLRSVSFMSGLDEDQEWVNLGISQKTINLYPSWLKYAAAVFFPLLVAGSIYFLNKTEDRVLTSADFSSIKSTNHKRATLVLASGEEVLLNVADPKLKNVAGAHVVNLDSTSLKYTAEQSHVAEKQFNELKVPRGGEYKLVLADGTQVWVNAASRLRFPVNFNGADKREVFLEEGEAYFMVAKNKAVPFIVHSGKMAIKVLGTSFNINTYSKKMVTTLVEGHVQVAIANSNKSVELLPDQQANFDQQTAALTNEDVEVESFVAWKDGWMIFSGSKLKDVMEQLGRWYDYNIEFESEKLKQIHFGGKLRKYNEIGTLLSIIEKTGAVKIEVKQQTIFIKEIPKNQ